MAKKKDKKGFLTEFKNFITRGNVLDLAVGLIIGTAFTAIVRSLTNDVLMPLIGGIVGGVDFAGLRIPLWNAKEVLVDGVVQYDAYGQKLFESAIYYGRFLQAVIDFLLIALVVFILVKIINALHERARLARERIIKQEKEENEQVAVPPKTPEDVLLLREIRDLLKKD